MTRLSSSAGILAVLFAIALGAQLRGGLHAAGEPDPRLPERLADTGLYVMNQLDAINGTVRAFAPQYPLWSDGLAKRRWIQLPDGGVIDGADEHAWLFPPGTRFWKEFSLHGRKVETRVLWKTGGRWRYGSYVWNQEGTDAVLAPDEGVISAIEVAPGRRHTIPSRADCAACHGPEDRGGPLGFNALQLSPDRDPRALHGEPLQDGMITLDVLAREGRLRQSAATAPVPRIRTQDPATRAVLGYLAANCSHCHNGSGEIAALGPTIRYSDLLRDGDAVARALLNAPTSWQLAGATGGSTVLVDPGSPERSALFARMKSRSPSSQMPPLGTVVRDQQALDAVAAWIAGPSAHVR